MKNTLLVFLGISLLLLALTGANCSNNTPAPSGNTTTSFDSHPEHLTGGHHPSSHRSGSTGVSSASESTGASGTGCCHTQEEDIDRNSTGKNDSSSEAKLEEEEEEEEEEEPQPVITEKDMVEAFNAVRDEDEERILAALRLGIKLDQVYNVDSNAEGYNSSFEGETFGTFVKQLPQPLLKKLAIDIKGDMSSIGGFLEDFLPQEEDKDALDSGDTTDKARPTDTASPPKVEKKRNNDEAVEKDKSMGFSLFD